MCNDCRGKLSKYALINHLYLTFADSESFCKNRFGTSLASIHDIYDHDLAANLCAMAQPPGGYEDCWIGANSRDNEDMWVWTDGTYFDYGSDLRGSVWPWGYAPKNNEPNKQK